jgi:hypothetical protein
MEGEVNDTRSANEFEASFPTIIPAVELTGSPQDKVRTLDTAIAQLQQLRRAVLGEPSLPPAHELRGRYINAPDWPWFTAGWVLGALFVLLLLLARSYA